MKKLLFLFATVMLLAACTNRNMSVRISGDIRNGGNAKMTLALITAEGMETIDSINLHDGHFDFKISSDNELVKERENAPMIFHLFLSDNNSIATMAKKGEHLEITADAENLTQTYRISGGEEAMLMRQLDSALTGFIIIADSMYSIYEENLTVDSVRADINTQYMDQVKKHRRYLEGFIAAHPNNMASYIAFYQSYNRRSFFDVQQDIDVLKQINANMSKVYPESEYVKTMIHVVEMVESRP